MTPDKNLSQIDIDSLVATIKGADRLLLKAPHNPQLTSRRRWAFRKLFGLDQWVLAVQIDGMNLPPELAG